MIKRLQLLCACTCITILGMQHDQSLIRAIKNHESLTEITKLITPININATDECGRRAIFYATMLDRIDVVRELFVHNARLDKDDKYLSIIAACSGADPEIHDLFIKEFQKQGIILPPFNKSDLNTTLDAIDN